jgi:hypothetical protein
MRLMRGAVAIGIARKIYTEARKPENQRRIKQAIEQIQAKRAAGGSSAGRRVRTR